MVFDAMLDFFIVGWALAQQGVARMQNLLGQGPTYMLLKTSSISLIYVEAIGASTAGSDVLCTIKLLRSLTVTVRFDAFALRVCSFLEGRIILASCFI